MTSGPRGAPARRVGAALRWARRVLSVLVLVAVVDYVVLPQLAGTARSMDLLVQVRPTWLAFGVLLEALSLGCYSLLSRSVLPGEPVPLLRMLRIDLAGLAVSHLTPAGAATGSALRYRLLRARGRSAEDASIGLTLETIGSTATLLSIFWLAVVAAIAVYGPTPDYVSTSLAGAVLVLSVGTVLGRRSRLSRPLTAVTGRLVGRLPARWRPRVSAALGGFRKDVGHLLEDPVALRACGLWAMGYWTLDAASLWVFVAAFGHPTNPVGLLVAYGLANTIGTLPITPGGLGLVEGVLIPGLIGFQVPSAVAVLGVLSWRLVGFWLPIPLGGLCYLSLKTPARGRRAGRARLTPR